MAAKQEEKDAAALIAENEALKKQLAEVEAKAKTGGAISGAYAELYQAKVAAGLDPKQAEEVTRAQMAHDESLKAGGKKAKGAESEG